MPLNPEQEQVAIALIRGQNVQALADRRLRAALGRVVALGLPNPEHPERTRMPPLAYALQSSGALAHRVVHMLLTLPRPLAQKSAAVAAPLDPRAPPQAAAAALFETYDTDSRQRIVTNPLSHALLGVLCTRHLSPMSLASREKTIRMLLEAGADARAPLVFRSPFGSQGSGEGPEASSWAVAGPQDGPWAVPAAPQGVLMSGEGDNALPIPWMLVHGQWFYPKPHRILRMLVRHGAVVPARLHGQGLWLITAPPAEELCAAMSRPEGASREGLMHLAYIVDLLVRTPAEAMRPSLRACGAELVNLFIRVFAFAPSAEGGAALLAGAPFAPSGRAAGSGAAFGGVLQLLVEKGGLSCLGPTTRALAEPLKGTPIGDAVAAVAATELRRRAMTLSALQALGALGLADETAEHVMRHVVGADRLPLVRSARALLAARKPRAEEDAVAWDPLVVPPSWAAP